MADAERVQPPAAFAQAVASLRAARLRPEVELGEIPPPQRLAPYSFALAAHVSAGEGPADQFSAVEGSDGATELASGRLILL